jgi:hypothetical protein
MNTLTEDKAKDLAVRITAELVKQGLVPDCTDTDDETEFAFQDAIEAALMANANK